MNAENQQGELSVRLFAANEAAIRSFVRRLVPGAERGGRRDAGSGPALEEFRPSLGDTDFRKWAYGVARNKVLAWRRDRARNRLVLALLADEAMEADDPLARQRDALRIGE